MRGVLAAIGVASLACASGPSAQELDVDRLRKAILAPVGLQCEGSSTWGGSMVREGLRIEVNCTEFSRSWSAGPVPPVALAQPGVEAPELARASKHTCTAYTLAQPNSNLFTAHPCEPWPEDAVQVELAGVIDGRVHGVYKAWY